jgi:cellulose synthase/poly-beta-1,6-N-acetylglucosamine synthase-like glycosyltransferase
MQTFYEIVTILFFLFQGVVALYLLIPFFSVVAYGVIKAFSIKHPFKRRKIIHDKNFEFGVIITAHQEVEFIKPLVASILGQTYQQFYIYVVADDCDISQLQFNDPRVIILSPQPALHAKIKSIDFARKSFIREHDVTLILDSDNLLHPNFLDVVNQHFQKGYRVVQADFKPKNEDSLYARIDAIGDMYNFFVDREIRMMAGMSAAIWGSGISFESSLYDEIAYKTMVGGFDKKLQSTLLLKTKKIAFSTDAVLYDEKVESGSSLENQRARWMLSYFNYFKESSKIFFTGLKTLNIDFIYFGFVLLRPPQFLLFAAAFFSLVLDFFLFAGLFYTWLGIIVLYVLSFATIILIRSKQIKYLKTLCMLPVFAGRQALALLKLRKASKSFLKTPHTKLLYIEDVLAKKEGV